MFKMKGCIILSLPTTIPFIPGLAFTTLSCTVQMIDQLTRLGDKRVCYFA